MGGVDWNKLHRFMLYGTLWSSCSEVVDFASLGRQAHCRGRLRSGFDPGLQTGVPHWVLMFIGRYLELDFVGSAASSHARCRCLILRKNLR